METSVTSMTQSGCLGSQELTATATLFEGHSAANNNLTLGFGSEGSLTFNTISGTPELTGVFDWS